MINDINKRWLRAFFCKKFLRDAGITSAEQTSAGGGQTLAKLFTNRGDKLWQNIYSFHLIYVGSKLNQREFYYIEQ
jgi:hypothetical protein